MAVLAFALVASAEAQGPPAAPAETVTVEPIECWWRTSANAIRVGELFTIVLTCSMLETANTTVVPDQTRLDPSVLQLLPFEITGGTQATDIRTDYRRFFQYEYTARYVGEEFGREIVLPPLSIGYRVQSRVQDDSSIESREREYVLPSQTLRVLSLVPSAASDIRERPSDTFQQIETRQFRGTVLRIVALSLFGLCAATVIIAIVGIVRKRGERKQTVVRHASDRAILAAVARELDEVRRRRLAEGWTPELAARALAPLRMVTAYALGTHVTQVEAPAGAEPAEGQLLLRPTFRGRKSILVSASATADGLALAIPRAAKAGRSTHALDDLESALRAFSALAYGRDDSAEPDLDDALEAGRRGLSHIRREHSLPVRTYRALTHMLSGGDGRAWAR